MTVADLVKRLGHYDGNLEVWIRCEWEGETPSSSIFRPAAVVQDIDHDTADDFIAIECDQIEEEP